MWLVDVKPRGFKTAARVYIHMMTCIVVAIQQARNLLAENTPKQSLKPFPPGQAPRVPLDWFRINPHWVKPESKFWP